MKKLLVVWKSDNDVDIHNFIMPFSVNSKRRNWFEEVEVLIWGASTKRIGTDNVIQDLVKSIVDYGIDVYACKYCADQVKSSEMLESLGVTVVYTGVYLSDKMKDPDWEVITI